MKSCCQAHIKKVENDNSILQTIEFVKVRCEVCGSVLLYDGEPAPKYVMGKLLDGLVRGELYLSSISIDEWEKDGCPKDAIKFFREQGRRNKEKGAKEIIIKGFGTNDGGNDASKKPNNPM